MRVESFRVDKSTRAKARAGALQDPAWRSAWVVRFVRTTEKGNEAVLGGGSSLRVAAMRAAEAAVAEGWF
jgi:hypothetical protein